MPQHSSGSVVRRRPVQSSLVDSLRPRPRHLSVSDNGSQSGGSRGMSDDRRSQAATWDVSSQISTAPANTSSMNSPGSKHPTSYSTVATEPSLVDSSKLKKLGPLHEHMEIIRKYQPAQAATDIWTNFTLELNADAAEGDKHLEADSNSSAWKFWNKMTSTADALATSEYLASAFDLHYICFLEIFNDTGQSLSHWESVSADNRQHDRDRKTSRVIAGTPPVLKLLIRSSIGAARSCTTASHGKLARVMLDATHSVLRQTKHPNRVRALLILLDIYRNTLMELWHEQYAPSSQNCYRTSPVSPKSSRLDQEYCLDDLVCYLHPAILNREYFLLSTHLLNLVRYQNSWLSLPARSTAWKKPLAQFVRDLAIPSKSGQAWVELTKQRPPSEPPDFIEAYLREAKAFILWCINTIFECDGALNESFTAERQATHVVSRDDLNHARLTLYWFLVGRREPTKSHTDGSAHSAATSLPSFPLFGSKPTTSDAFFVLASFIFGFCTPEPLPSSLPSMSDYAMARLKQITKWPYGFVWYYLQNTVSFASRLHTDGDFLQETIDLKHLEFATMTAENSSSTGAAVNIAAELHPQPLPEFIIGDMSQHAESSRAQSKTSSPRSPKVAFSESPEECPIPAISSKRRWLKRLSGSISRIDATTFQTLADKSSLTKILTTSSTTSTNATNATNGTNSQASSNKSSKASSKRTSLAIVADTRAPRRTTSSIDGTGRFHPPDGFPGDYTAVVPLMSSPNTATESGNATEPASAKGEASTATVPPVEADKIGSVVRSSEVPLPESRPSFLVLR